MKIPTLCMALLLVCADLAAQNIRKGLVAYYPFSGNAEDASGLSKKGIVQGATLTTDRFGSARRAYAFNGKARIRLPVHRDHRALYNGDFTVSYWQKSTAKNRMYSFGVDPEIGAKKIFLSGFNGSSGCWAQWNGAAGAKIQAGIFGSYTNGAWHHVLMRRKKDKGLIEIFIDGKLTGQANQNASAPAPNAAKMDLGYDDQATAQGWRGELDDVSVYNRSLSDQEVNMLADDGLVVFYPFDSGPYDESGNKHDATVLGASLSKGRSGDAQGAYHFSGHDTIRIPRLAHVPDLFDRDFTISFWQKSGDCELMYAMSIEGGWGKNLNIGFNGFAGGWAYWNGGGSHGLGFGPAGGYSDSEWHHVVLRRSKSRNKLEFFLDGNPVGEETEKAVAIGTNAADIYLGQNILERGNSHGWMGDLDEIAIYNRAVTDGEINTLPYGERIELSSPMGGETWSAGSSHYITWKSRPDGDVKLEYSLDDGVNWLPIADNALVSNRHLWTVPESLSDSCRVRVTSNRSPYFESRSPMPFRIAPSQKADYTWTPIYQHAEAPFPEMDGAFGSVFKGKMWLMGGWNPYWNISTSNDIWSSRDGVTWDSSAAPWEGRHSAGYAVHDDKMWILGGDLNRGHYQTNIWSSADGESWQMITDTLSLFKRVLHLSAAHDGKIWIMGGQLIPDAVNAWDPMALKDGFFNDVWNSTDGITWKNVLSHAPWANRGIFSGNAVFQGKMWILGGGTYGTRNHPYRAFFHDIWNSSDGIDWKRVVEYAPWNPRQYHNVAVFDGKLWILAGGNPAYAPSSMGMNDAWYSSDGVNWYEVPKPETAYWLGRHAATVFVQDNTLWMTAGFQKDVWKLTPAH